MAAKGVLRTLEAGKVSFLCPGCKDSHVVRIVPDGQLPCWGFNGNYEKPTFVPSYLLKATWSDPPVTPENLAEWKRNPWPQKKLDHVCHSFVTDGQIKFLNDCTHALAGQTVLLVAEECE
jgi:hypothetical protein